MGLVALATVGCDLVAPFSEPVPVEESAEHCADGVDNDLDGLADCADPSCRCDACGDKREPRVDRLGTACSEDCACRRAALSPLEPAQANLRVCNLAALVGDGRSEGRCLDVESLDERGAPSVEEGRFWVRFAAETGPEPAVQSVVGLARFGGQLFPLARIASLDGGRRLLFGQGSGVLEAVLFERPRGRIPVGDGVGSEPNEAVRAQLGPADADGLGGVNQVAVVETSELEVEEEDGVIRGQWSGRLRAAGAIDRARGGRCGGIAVFHPEPQRCFPSETDADRAFFAFGCPLEPDAPTGAGRMALWWWPTYLNSPQVDFEGDCAARVVGDRLELRLSPSRRIGPPFVARIEAPIASVAASTSLSLGPGLTAEVHRVTPSGPPFTVGLGTPAVVFERGRLFIERIGFEAAPRVFGWLEADLP